MSIVVVVALGRSQAGFWADSVSQQTNSFSRFNAPIWRRKPQRVEFGWSWLVVL